MHRIYRLTLTKGDDNMRYESFYPFSQPGPNNFFQPNNTPPVNTTPPANNILGMASRFFSGNQPSNTAPSPGFFGMPPNAPGPQANNPFGGFSQSPSSNASFGGFSQGTQTGKGMSYLQTADKFLNTAQQITPLVRQYAPMLQNVPALWKLYRGFQSVPNATGGTAAAAAASATASTAGNATSAARTVASATTNTTGASLPRIFQPPI